MNTDELRATLLALPPHERAKLAQDLLHSLDAEGDAELEAAWVREIQRRAQELADGTVTPADWEAARDRIARRLRERRG